MKIVSSCSAPYKKRPELDTKINQYAAKKNLQKAGGNKYSAYTIDFQGSRTWLMVKTVAALVFSFGISYPLSNKVRAWCEILKYGGSVIGTKNQSSSAISKTSTAILTPPVAPTYQFSKDDIQAFVSEGLKVCGNHPSHRDLKLDHLTEKDVKLLNTLFNDFEKQRAQAKQEQQIGVFGVIITHYQLKNFKYSKMTPADSIDLQVACHQIDDETSSLGEAPGGEEIALTPFDIQLLFGCFYMHTNGGSYTTLLSLSNVLHGEAYKHEVVIK